MEGIARVFFRDGEVGFQPLSNHQGLVERLLEAWEEGGGPLQLHPETRDRLREAARYHDDGKRHTFQVKREGEHWTYSFQGHRFRVAKEVVDPYAQALIRGHHDYSTREVVNTAGSFEGTPLRRRYPEDLFLLMMADQLEAELAVRLYEGREGEVRPFVEFDLIPDPESPDSFFLDPWPFKGEEVALEYRAYFRPLGGADASQVTEWGKQLAQALGDGKEPEGYRLEPRRAVLKPWPSRGRSWDGASDFYGLFNLPPRPLQEEVFQLAREDLAHLLFAPTGSGKTEAALFPALARGQRAVFVLPTRSLVDDLERRFSRYLRVLAREEGRPKSLVVDTGHRQVRYIFFPDGKLHEARGQHLYHADAILTTLDKLLYRYFGYASGVKSYVFPKRIHDGHTLFVFDEVHLYEGTAWVNFRHLVAALSEAGVPFLIMSATMPEEYQEELQRHLLGKLQPKDTPVRPSRVLRFIPQGNVDTLRDLAKEHRGRRVLLVVEEVRDAVKLYQELKGEGVFLYHGRLADGQRRRVFEKVKELDEKEGPYTLITTPAIEVGVDLDAEILLTTLCPPENLLQRLGRVNRRGKGRGEAYVVGSEYPEYLGTLPEGYRELLKELDGKDLAQAEEGGLPGEERLRQSIRYPRYVDERARAFFEMLREYVYELDLTQEPLHRKGIVATRGWTPSVRLRARLGNGEVHEVEVPVDRLVHSDRDKASGAEVWERVWSNREEGRTLLELPLRSGELYGRELVVDYPFDYDPELGFVEIPKVFQRIRHSDPQRVLLLYRRPQGSRAGKGVLDADQATGKEQKAVVWYLADSAVALEGPAEVGEGMDGGEEGEA